MQVEDAALGLTVLFQNQDLLLGAGFGDAGCFRCGCLGFFLQVRGELFGLLPQIRQFSFALLERGLPLLPALFQRLLPFLVLLFLEAEILFVLI